MCSATATTSSTCRATTSRSPPPTCSPWTGRPARSPSRACAATSGSACSYLDAWLSGNGAAGIDNLMEDAATAEISRSQIWQWVHNGARLDTGEVVTHELVERLVAEEHAALDGHRRRRRAPPVRRVRARRGLPRLPHPAGVRRPAGTRRLTGRTNPPDAICSPPTHTSATSASPAIANTLPSAPSGESACRRPMSRAVPAGGRTRTASNCLPTERSPTVSAEPERGGPGGGAEVEQVCRRERQAVRTHQVLDPPAPEPEPERPVTPEMFHFGLRAVTPSRRPMRAPPSSCCAMAAAEARPRSPVVDDGRDGYGQQRLREPR